MRRAPTAGSSLLDLLLGAALGLLVLTAVGAALAAAARALGRVGALAQTEDAAHAALEAFTFDVRQAGYDPAAAAVEPVALARDDRVVLQADTNADAVVDANSAELVTWVCARGARRLSRMVGAQSMPLADDVQTCAFSFLDRDGVPLVPPAAGLDAPSRSRIGAIGIDVRLAVPGSPRSIARSLVVALASVP